MKKIILTLMLAAGVAMPMHSRTEKGAYLDSGLPSE